MQDRIETFQDLLDLLDANPHWAQALRERLLTPELLALPEKFAAFADMVERRFQALEADMTQVKADVAELKTDMTQVKADVAELKTDMVQVKSDVAELKSDVGDLKGHAVPWAAQRMMGMLVQAANVRRPRWVDSAQIVHIANDAEDEGTADIPPNEMQSFLAIDLAMTAIDKTSGAPCYVVIECSYTVTRNDVDRALRNAGHMTRFTGVPAKALAAGSTIPEQVSAYAKEKGVECVLVTPKASAPV